MMVATKTEFQSPESYQAPALRVLGTLAELTMGPNGGSTDGIGGASPNVSMGNEYHSGV